jgi:phosphatidylserine decarboxylase
MAPEGRSILIPGLVLAVLSGAAMMWQPQAWLSVAAGLLWILVGLSLIFFRDPVRTPSGDSRAVLSPADGKVVTIEPIGYDPHLGSEALRVSIFLSLFNVHVQRVPADARVEATDYRSGRFFAAFRSRASRENEQAVVHFIGNGGKFTVKQIAGTLARRIICYMAPERVVQRGDRLGFIRFGSRVDLIVPADFQLQVKVGDRVRGVITNIGYFAS